MEPKPRRLAPCYVTLVQEDAAMQVVHPVCCGLDVHQATLKACLRHVSADGQITTELRDFGKAGGSW